MITLLVMTDGRKDCIERAIPAALANLHGPTPTRIIHDDSGDPAYEDWLWATFEPFGFHVHSTGKRQGFAGAIRSAWAWLLEHDRNQYIFHLEDDFVVAPVKLGDMVHTLIESPDIVQLALLRQAWNSEEKAAGGIIAQHPDDYRTVGNTIQHRRFFTTNPSLYRRELIVGNDWPEGKNSEGRFSIKLFADDPAAVSAFWTDGELCEHIGTNRIGTGY